MGKDGVLLTRGQTTGCLRAAEIDAEVKQELVKTSRLDPTKLRTSTRSLARKISIDR